MRLLRAVGMASAFFGAAVPALGGSQAGAAVPVLVGGVSGAYGGAFSLNTTTGVLALTSSSQAFGASPAYMALSPDRAMLYVTNHNAGPASGVTSLSVTWSAPGASGARVPAFALQGFVACDDPAHIALHPSGLWAMTASYSAGTVSLFAVDAARTLRLQTTVPAGANAHQVVYNNACVYVPCLGDDTVAQFTLDPGSGALRPLAMAPTVSLPAGSGPRHMAISSDGRRAWVLCELSSQLFEFEFDVGGSLVPVAGVPPVNTTRPGRPPAQVQAAAAIVLSEDGRFIYVSNRASGQNGTGDNSVLALAVGAPGTPATPVSWADAGGALAFPRDISLLRVAGDPFLVVASQHGNSLSVFARDAASGALNLVGAAATPSAPVQGPSFVLPLAPW